MSDDYPDDELERRRRAVRAEAVTSADIMRTAWELWLEGGITSVQLAQTCKLVGDKYGRPRTPTKGGSDE